MNINKTIILGRLTRDPEMRTTPSGQNVTNISVATSRGWKDKNGQWQEKPEYHNVVIWGKRAEVINQYFVKGQEIFLEGRLETRNWEDKDTGKKMYRTEIILDNFEFGAKAGAGGQSQGSGYNNHQNTVPTATPQQPSTDAKGYGVTQKEEEIPTINLDDEADEVKIEDVPF